ncbi:MAG: SRPBCC family protein [Nitrospirota bacterium]
MRGLVRLIVWLAGLAVVVLIASKFLFEPTYTVSSQVVIQAPPGRVWDKVGTFEQWPSWIKGIERFEITLGEGRETGSVANAHVYNGFGGWDLEIRLTEVVPPMRLRYQLLGGPQSGAQSLIELKPSEDVRATTVTWNESHTPGGVWGNLLAAVMKSVVTTHHDESLNQLKFALERGI